MSSSRPKEEHILDQQEASQSHPQGKPDEQLRYSINLAQSISDAVIATDREFRIREWNVAAEKMYGWSRDEVVGKNVSAVLKSDLVTISLDERIEQLMSKGVWKGEVLQQRKDGSAFPVLSSVSFIKDSKGKVIGAVSVNRDISERKMLEEQLRLSETRYRTMFEQSLLSMQIFSPDGITLMVNRAWEELWQTAPEQIRAYNILQDEQLVKQGIMPYIRKAFQGEATAIPAIKYEPDKTIPNISMAEYRWVRGYIYPVKDEAGNVREVVLTHVDITESKYLEVELRKAKEQLETIFQNVADGITVQDASGRVIYANESGARAVGFPSVEAMLHTANESMQAVVNRFEIKDEWGMPLSIDQLPGRKALREGKRTQAVVQYRSNGSERTSWSLLKAQPIFDEEGQVQFAVNVYTDITESRELELRKDEFIGVASHELRTPLTSVKGFVQLLHKRFLKREDAETLQMLDRVNGQLNKLAGLINDLLDLTKMQSGKLPFREESFDLGALVSETVADMQASATTHRIKLVSSAHAQIYGDKDRIGQVLINLLTNAIKYSPGADTIIVRVAKEQQQAMVSVQDFGIGIAEAHLSRVFERFYQVIDTPQRAFPGLGIGLYISCEIIQRHGGRIWVESKPGVGSTFTFTLPLLA